MSLSVARDAAGAPTHYVCMFSDISGEKAQHQRLEFLANNDALTGLSNRLWFCEQLEDAVVQARGSGERMAVLQLNLDRFKDVNDSYGHAVGDQVLKHIAQQVQSVCDAAKFTAAYFSGKEAPKHPDTEKTMAELRERIQKCVTFLETVSEKDCSGADTKKISPAWLKGKWVQGDHYALQIAIPNFYFHIATAYSILRHNGVELGKMDFIGNVPMRDA